MSTNEVEDPSQSRRAKMREDYEQRREKALAMGGTAKLQKRKAQGLLNARERIDRLFDPGTFIESGLFSTSAVPAD